MAKTKSKKESVKALLASVTKEMAQPRMAASAQRAEVDPAAPRIVRGKPGLGVQK